MLFPSSYRKLLSVLAYVLMLRFYFQKNYNKVVFSLSLNPSIFEINLPIYFKKNALFLGNRRKKMVEA